MNTQMLKMAIQLIMPSVSGKNSLASVVKCVRFSFKDSFLTLTSSNLEQSSMARCESDQDITGAFLLDGEAVKALLRLSGEETSFSIQGKSLAVSSGHVNLTLPTQEADGFPSMIEDSVCEWSDEISTELLANAVQAVAHSAGREKHRQNLMGIRFILKSDGTAITVATDGHRMSINNILVSNVFQSMLLPVSSIKAIQKSINDSMTCSIGVGKIQNEGMIVSGGQSFMIQGETDIEEDDEDGFSIQWQHAFRLMAEQGYPDVESVFNMMIQGDKADVLVDIKPIRSAIGLANIFDSYKRCILTFENNFLVLTTKSEKGQAVIQLGLLSTVPDSMCDDYMVAVNGDYLMQSLGSCGADECLISFPVSNQSNKPLIISAGSKKDLIMPMRV